MRLITVVVGTLALLMASSGVAPAYKLGGPGGVCPKDPKAQCEVTCDNGQLADYMKWTGSAWSDLVGKIKDADMNSEAKKIVAKSNSDNKAMGAPADCK